MSSRKLTDLHPKLESIALQMFINCKDSGIELLIYCTYRSDSEQDRLYSFGRTEGGSIVTNAQAGESLHNFTLNGRPAALAFDCVPLINGKAYWQNTGEGASIWQVIGLKGKELGLRWGGDFKRGLVDMPHFELDLRSLPNEK